MANGADTEALTSLAEQALARWEMVDAAMDLIKIRENAVFEVTRPEGFRAVLRVHRAGYHTDAALRSEFQWMAALNSAGIETPEPIAASDGSLFVHQSIQAVPEPRQVDMLSWVDGQPLGSIEEGFAEGVSVESAFRTIGALAARMHNQVESWPLPEGFARGAFDVDGLTGSDPWWGVFWDNVFLDEKEKALALGVRDRLRRDLIAFGTGADRFGLIHADLLPENLLVDGDRIQLIDFDDAAFGWHLFDLSTPLFFHLGEDYFDDAVAAMVAGYRSERPLPDTHLALLPMFLTARGTTYLGWMQSRSETEEIQEIGPSIAAGVVELMTAYLQSDPLEGTI